MLMLSSLMVAGKLHAEFVIDNFEDGNISAKPEWWKFDRLILDVVDITGKAPKGVTLGKKGLSLEGSTRDWYIGGLGTYLGIDAMAYKYLDLLVYGNGKNSGQLKIELWDDDNNNWKAEQDPKKNYIPMYDDRLIYTLVVDWEGWKKMHIPITDFEDDNSGVGNDKWDPAQANGSAGLLQVSMVALGKGAKGQIQVVIDEIKLSEK